MDHCIQFLRACKYLVCNLLTCVLLVCSFFLPFVLSSNSIYVGFPVYYSFKAKSYSEFLLICHTWCLLVCLSYLKMLFPFASTLMHAVWTTIAASLQLWKPDKIVCGFSCYPEVKEENLITWKMAALADVGVIITVCCLGNERAFLWIP